MAAAAVLTPMSCDDSSWDLIEAMPTSPVAMEEADSGSWEILADVDHGSSKTTHEDDTEVKDASICEEDAISHGMPISASATSRYSPHRLTALVPSRGPGLCSGMAACDIRESCALCNRCLRSREWVKPG